MPFLGALTRSVPTECFAECFAECSAGARLGSPCGERFRQPLPAGLRVAAYNTASYPRFPMFSQAFQTALRILVFRAGPEDFPYDPRSRLTAGCVAFALLANTAFVAVIVPPASALLSAAINLGLMALLTRGVLSARKLDNRFQQTFNALLLCSGALSALMAPLFAQIAPTLLDFMHRAAEHPELLDQPDAMPQLPALPEHLLSVLGFWQLAVIGYIYYKAAGGPGVFALMAMMLVMLLLMSASVGAQPLPF